MPPPSPPVQFTSPPSVNSSEAMPDNMLFCRNFQLGAGTVIIQPSTGKIVLVYSARLGRWFLPKGRKDIGESLEQAALREAYEETGYRVRFFPLVIPTRAPWSKSPNPPGTDLLQPQVLNTEPFYITTRSHSSRSTSSGYEYITFWYVTFIGSDAVEEENTRMPDEYDYQTSLMDVDEAVEKLSGTQQGEVVTRAYKLWMDTKRYSESLEESRDG